MPTPLHDNRWVCSVPFRAMGFPIGRQLVVVRIPSGNLRIQSPIPWTPALRTNLARLGEIHHVVAPNCYHDECLKEFQVEDPTAKFHSAPGLADQRRDLRFAATPLSDTPRADWQGAVDQHLVKGIPGFNESIFLHRASRSLIISDLAFRFGPDSPWLIKFVMLSSGGVGRFGSSRFCKSRIKDRPAVREPLDTIPYWELYRIIVTHGQNVVMDGKRFFREAFAFLA